MGCACFPLDCVGGRGVHLDSEERADGRVARVRVEGLGAELHHRNGAEENPPEEEL